MTLDDMREECEYCLATGMIAVLTIQKGKKPKTFPKVDLMSEEKRNGVVERIYWCEPFSVLTWLDKQGKENGH